MYFKSTNVNYVQVFFCSLVSEVNNFCFLSLCVSQIHNLGTWILLKT